MREIVKRATNPLKILTWVFASMGLSITVWLILAFFKWQWHYLFINETGLTFGLAPGN